ncbi:hypothetical protein W97_07762 [Coniosporium apollinis CBS 100218]|uniref:Uncharacterized protein n=1 Tax=Coniosporium apollinis (strain CBS 100218) TaxID=1168221 RepID=R7Z395_CONA1|nr:uncharacterized protein W97_07762 [Coniosporium apollinis CBS 100218]EON68504.1 hypothetical protein W97_07762 [Coniosporium apollinis CBS 100218]
MSPFKRPDAVGDSAKKGGGWRLEEGISEWVTMTPASLLATRFSVQASVSLPSPVLEAEHASPMVVIHRGLQSLGMDGTHETPCKPSLSRMLLGSSPIDAIVGPDHALTEKLERRRLKRSSQSYSENLGFDPAPKRRRGRPPLQPQRLADITNTISPPDLHSKSTTPSSKADADAPVLPRTRKAQKATGTTSKELITNANDEDELSLIETQLQDAKENLALRGKSIACVKKRHNLRSSVSTRSAGGARDAVRSTVDESEGE